LYPRTVLTVLWYRSMLSHEGHQLPFFLYAQVERSTGYGIRDSTAAVAMGYGAVQSGSCLPTCRRNDSKHIRDQTASPLRKQYFILYVFTRSLIRLEAFKVGKRKSVLAWKGGGGVALTGQRSYFILLLFGNLDLCLLSKYYVRHCPLYENTGYFSLIYLFYKRRLMRSSILLSVYVPQFLLRGLK
jgi:hypothetical protein